MRTHYLPRETIICNRPARVVLHGCEHASAVSCRKLTYQMQSLWLAIRCIMMRHGALKTRSTFRCRMQINRPGTNPSAAWRNSIQPLMNQAICSTGCWTKTSRLVKSGMTKRTSVGERTCSCRARRTAQYHVSVRNRLPGMGLIGSKSRPS